MSGPMMSAESFLSSLPPGATLAELEPSLAQMFASGVSNLLPPPDVRAQVEAHLRTVRQTVAQRPFGCRAGTAVNFTSTNSSSGPGQPFGQRPLPPGLVAPTSVPNTYYPRVVSGASRPMMADSALTAALLQQVYSMGSAPATEGGTTSTVTTDASSQPMTFYDAMSSAFPALTQADLSAFIAHRGALQAMASGALDPSPEDQGHSHKRQRIAVDHSGEK